MIIIYTGDGKGKTSACVGQAMRALGHGMKVVFAQFIKRDHVAGEQKILRKLLGSDFRADGLGFFRHEEQRESQREAASGLLRWAAMRDCDMLVLDESLYALNAGLILKEELECLAQNFRNAEKILVLSGRGLPDWLVSYGDIITTLEPTRHIYASGVHAAKGIEY